MTRAWILNLSRLSLCVFLASCKAPVSFSSLETASVSSSTDETGSSSSAAKLSDEDQEVVDSICQRATSESQNAFEGNVLEKPFLNLSFASPQGLHIPKEKCVNVTVVEDSDSKREVLYTYDCKDVSGTVQFSTEHRDESVYSKIATDVKITEQKSTRHLTSKNANEKYKSGALILDQDFNESFTLDNNEHVISGSATYDFAPDQVSDEEGIIPYSGIVQMNGNLTHTKNGETASVRTFHSEDLHRSSCGFDEGRITVHDADKTVTVTFTACGKKSVVVTSD